VSAAALPEGWKATTLGSLCRIELGSTPPRKSKSNWDEKHQTENVWLSIADMPTTLHAEATDSKEYVSSVAAKKMRLVPKGTLLVSFKLTLGRLCYAGRDLFTNEAIAALLDLDGKRISQKYLYWYLTFFDWQKAAASDEKLKGKTLNKAKLKLLRVLLPPLEEQEQIVTTLDEAFAALDRARALAERNLADAQELFENWLASTFGARAADWKRLHLPDISENLDRMRVPITRRDRVAGSVPYYGASGVVDHVADYIFDEDLLLVSEDGANLLARSYPIAFSISGKSWVNNHAHVLRFESRTDQEFVSLFLESISLEPFVSGMAQPKLTQKALNRIPVPYPDRGTREKIVSEAQTIAAATAGAARKYQETIEDFEDLRRSLLQKAFSGELT
jgi:type I restriction enzyme S subunit